MTTLTYITQPDATTLTATITDYRNRDTGVGLILDQTIFYVQGGGQPSDHGHIKIGTKDFEVTKVIRDRDDILHFGSFSTMDLKVGDQVVLTIDKGFRDQCSRLHSAGHMIDILVHEFYPHLTDGKGYHYPDGAYCEYHINDQILEENETIKLAIQTAADEFINQNIPVEITIDNNHTRYGQPLRTMNFKGHEAMGCGGTHIQSSAELADFTIRSIKIKKGVLKVGYDV
jgi:Ser-tRNA(Ala) deacylase AlaX